MVGLALTLALVPVASVQTYSVGDLERQAIVHPGTGKAPRAGRPLVLVFHGHGGTMGYAERRQNVHSLWPEATVVYPQGLPTTGIADPEGKENGWQKSPGAYGDRDLGFVDAILAREKGIDPARVYATGHSNGGRFVYVLWAKRGDRFAAYGPSGSPSLRPLTRLRPTSFLATAGESDPIVPFRGQKLGVDGLARLFGADLANGAKSGPLTIARGRNGVEVGTYFFEGGHEFPPDAVAATVALFKRTSRR